MAIRFNLRQKLLYSLAISAVANLMLVFLDTQISQFEQSKGFVWLIASIMAAPGYTGAKLLGASGHDIFDLLPKFLLSSVTFYAVVVFLALTIVQMFHQVDDKPASSRRL